MSAMATNFYKTPWTPETPTCRKPITSTKPWKTKADKKNTRSHNLSKQNPQHQTYHSITALAQATNLRQHHN
jgi:hypothetical protein